VDDLLFLHLSQQLSRDEGRVATLYRDDRGHPTIGIGFNLDVQKMPREVMDLWLRLIVTEMEGEVVHGVPAYKDLSSARQGALLNMAYTMGVVGLQTFTHMLTRLAMEDYAGAAAAIRASVWATKEAPARAERTARQVESDTWV
jgi:lysozyme